MDTPRSLTKEEEFILKGASLLPEAQRCAFVAVLALMNIEARAKEAQEWVIKSMGIGNYEKTPTTVADPEPLNAKELALLVPQESDDAWKNMQWSEYASYSDVDIDRSNTTGHGYIYIAEFGEYLKIGYTISPKNRLAAHLQTARNYGVIITGRVLLSPAHKDYTKTEKAIHDYFKEYRKAGTELFEIAFEDAREKIKSAPSE